jgi:hypothetical protein
MQLSTANPADNGRGCNASKLVAGTGVAYAHCPSGIALCVDIGSAQQVPCTSGDAQRLMVACCFDCVQAHDPTKHKRRR